MNERTQSDIRIQAVERERDALKIRGDQHWETLRSIRVMAREGDCERIIQWVSDAGSGYVESAETTLGEALTRANTAEAERDQLRQRVEAAEGEKVRLKEIADLARELISPKGMVNRGVDRGLVVIEKPDKSDPHWRLCTALEVYDRASRFTDQSTEEKG